MRKLIIIALVLTFLLSINMMGVFTDENPETPVETNEVNETDALTFDSEEERDEYIEKILHHLVFGMIIFLWIALISEFFLFMYLIKENDPIKRHSAFKILQHMMVISIVINILCIIG